MVSFRSSPKFDKDVSVVVLSETQTKSKNFPFKNKEIENQISLLTKSGAFSGEDGQIFPLNLSKTFVLLVGIGKAESLSLTAFRSTVRRALLSSYLKKAKSVEILVHDHSDSVVCAAIEAVLLGTYSFDKYKTQDNTKSKAEKKQYVFAVNPQKKYDEAVTVCEGTNLARDLINENADVKTSDYLEKVIKDVVKGHKNISLEILNKKEMEKNKLGLHLAVNQGSKNEPKLIIVKYNGASAKDGYTAFIGKGMTFDTGGLNIKTTGHMETMKIDMSGTAAVIGTLKNTIALNLKKNILFVCAIAENAIDQLAYKPGDVLISYSGKTVEVGNTDAEGRLVLADAISYVVKNYKPARIIDIATLTGACVVALGYEYTGLMTTDDKFSRALVHASNETDDRVWRLPMYPELKEHVKSKIADIKNTGLRGAAGTVSAAEFLRQFTENTPWAHLDIAGTSYNESGDRWYFGFGATGAGVRLMTRYLQSN